MTHLEAADDGPHQNRRLAEGDIVLLGPSGALAFEVMAVRGDKAWIRDLDDGRHGVVDLDDFRRAGLSALRRVQ